MQIQKYFKEKGEQTTKIDPENKEARLPSRASGGGLSYSAGPRKESVVP